MINKLIEKYKETKKQEDEKGYGWGCLGEYGKSEIIEEIIKDLEELKKQINTLNIETINAPNIVITQIMKNEIIGVDTDE